MVSQFERIIFPQREVIGGAAGAGQSIPAGVPNPPGSITIIGSTGTAGGTSGGGDGGAAARRAAELERQRLADLERQRKANAERQRQSQLESQRQADQQRQQQQQTVITSRRQTLSSGGTPLVNIQLGKDVAEFNRRSFEEARKRGRNLFLSEKEGIARDVLDPKPKEEKLKTSTEIIPGTTGQSDVQRFTPRKFLFSDPGLRQPIKSRIKEIESQKGFGNFQNAIERQFEKAALKVTLFSEPFVPPSRLKTFLFKGREGVGQPIRITDVAKFGFFSPALATTPSAISSTIQRNPGALDIQTQFKATIQPKGEIQQLQVVSETKAGGLNIQGISKQVSKDLGDDASLTIGKTISGRRIPGAKVEFTNIDVGGVGKITGRAGVTKDVGGLKLTKELGTGVQIESVSSPTQTLIQRRGIGLFKEFSVKNIPTAKVSFIRGGKITPIIQKESLSGVLKDIGDDTLVFAGKTGKATTRITPQGISKGFKPQEINVRGVIKTIQDASTETSGGVTFVSPGTIQRTSLAKTFAPQQKEILTQASALSSQGTRKILDITTTPIKTTPLVTKTSASSLTPSIKQTTTKIITPEKISFGRIPSLSDTGKVADLGVSANRLTVSSLLSTSTAQKQPLKEQQKLRQIQKPQQKPRQLIDLGQVQQQQQNQRQRLQLRTQLKQPQRLSQKAFTIQTPKISRVSKLPFVKVKIPRTKLPKQSSGKFEVFGRRFGKFKSIGVARSEKGAFTLGKRFAGKTLGATFKVPKSKVTKLPGFRTKITGEGTLFIEPRKRRLKKRGSEVAEIQIFKRAKKRRKKK